MIRLFGRFMCIFSRGVAVMMWISSFRVVQQAPSPDMNAATIVHMLLNIFAGAWLWQEAEDWAVMTGTEEEEDE